MPMRSDGANAMARATFIDMRGLQVRMLLSDSLEHDLDRRRDESSDRIPSMIRNVEHHGAVGHLDLSCLIAAVRHREIADLLERESPPNAPAPRPATPRRCPCTPGSAGNSFRQPADHGQDAVGDAFQFSIDLGQRARRLEDVEVPVEGDFVADLGLVVVDPGIGRMG